MNESDSATVDPRPRISVFWDAESQSVGLHFGPQDFKTWDMVAMVLTQALDEAKFRMNIARTMNMQQQAAQAAQTQAIRQALKF